jgi:hypothetical protein
MSSMMGQSPGCRSRTFAAWTTDASNWPPGAAPLHKLNAWPAVTMDRWQKLLHEQPVVALGTLASMIQ